MQPTVELLQRIGNRLRILSIAATTRAGSGHPTSCCSAADLVAALFFGKMRFNPDDPHYRNNDRFVLSKGHAAPLLYAAWEETGHVSTRDIESLRRGDSPFEGHPTPRLDFVDVATGSLGQGLSAALGMAIAARMDHLDFITYVLLGDGELAEGSVWEAASLAGFRRESNLVAIVDVNRLGQSQPTAFGREVEVYQERFEAFGWNVITINGHDVKQILSAYAEAGVSDRPLAILASTIKGKGIPGVEDQDGWHGRPLPEAKATEAIAALTPNAQSARGRVEIPHPKPVLRLADPKREGAPAPDYDPAKPVSVRLAFGHALARLGAREPSLVALDGDVENSTCLREFAKRFPERRIECYIAEQNMLGVAVGLGVTKTPFVSTFAAFFTRAYDQIRMASISRANLKLVGTHCGISIGEDGPSQMGLEDIAMMRAVQECVVLSPCDAYSTERLIERMLQTRGIQYLRASRPDSPILYKREDDFTFGGATVLRDSSHDVATVVATGITVFEALQAYELLKRDSVFITVIDAYSIRPLGADVIRSAALRCGGPLISVEDHYAEGGLGDAIAGEIGLGVQKLAVRGIPHSGKGTELMAEFGIDAQAIVRAVRENITPYLGRAA